MSFAIIETGGKQYKVSVGDKIKTEFVDDQENNLVVFDKVLLRSEGDNFDLGKPYLEGGFVEGKVLKEGRDKRKIVFKYHSKTRYRKKKTHRQRYSEVEITKIK